jgi:flagellar hook-associated protein 3 FlgL
MSISRVTFPVLVHGLLRDIQTALRGVEDARVDAATGKRVRRVSDDPPAGAAILDTAAQLRAIEQYRRNGSVATAHIASEEAALAQLDLLLARAREIAVQQANDTVTAGSRAAAKAEVLRLIESASDLGNTRVADGYLFGGATSHTPPFSAPGVLAAGNTPTRSVEISPGQLLRLSHNATEVFVDTGVLAALEQLVTALDSGDVVAIGGAAGDLTAAQDALQGRIADVGGRALRLEAVLSNLDALELNLRSHRSNLEDVDFETAVTELVGRQSALQAALLAASRMLSFNLTDYLR